MEREDGIEERDINGMGEVATSYFESLFTSNGVGNLSHILFGIEVYVSLKNNVVLTLNFMAEEIFAALKEMGTTKASRVDGFLTMFF